MIYKFYIDFEDKYFYLFLILLLNWEFLLYLLGQKRKEFLKIYWRNSGIELINIKKWSSYDINITENSAWSSYFLTVLLSMNHYITWSIDNVLEILF